MMEYQDMRRFSLEHGRGTSIVLEELSRRYHSPAALHFPFAIGDKPAFVMLNGELHALISSIYAKNNALNRLCLSIPSDALDQYAKSAMVEEIQQTNEVENVRSTRKEIREAMEDIEKPDSNRRFTGMVKKYQMLITHKPISIVSCTDIRKLYDEFLLDEVVRESAENAPDGVIFRKGPIGVYSANDQKIHSGLFPENKIIEAMEQGLAMLKQEDIDILIRIAAFHYLFAYIHPFYDGNGRMTRFISSYMLSQQFNESACLRIAFVIKEKKSSYYRLFKEANDKRSLGDLTSFVTGFLRFFETALIDTYKVLEEKKTRYLYYTMRMRQYLKKNLEKLDIKYRALLESLLRIELFGFATFTIQELAQIADCNPRTMRKVMDQCGDLVFHSTGKTFYWHINLSTLDGMEDDMEA